MIQKYIDGEAKNYLKRLEIRFWSKVKKTPTCWVWIGSKNQFGRGLFRVGPACVAAPRISWELTHGVSPGKLFVLHSCDNPSCVNPEHLRLGDQKENMSDREERGRNRGPDFNRNKTHCKWGHEFTLENTHVRVDGYRECRACHRIRENSYNTKKRLDARQSTPHNS